MKPVTVGTGLAIAGAVHAAVNAVLLRRPIDGPVRSRVSVLIPARDEADCIGACLDSIDGADEVLVLDDGSRDATAEVARAHGARVLSGTSLPPGWLGKPHACAQLAAAASGDVLVFVDADVRLRPGAIRAAVHFLESSGWDLVSPHPRQATGSVAERLVQPLLQWSILTTLPLRLAERSHATVVGRSQRTVPRRATRRLRAGRRACARRGARRSRARSRDQAQRRPRWSRRRHLARDVPDVWRLDAIARRLRQIAVVGVRRSGRQQRQWSVRCRSPTSCLRWLRFGALASGCSATPPVWSAG